MINRFCLKEGKIWDRFHEKYHPNHSHFKNRVFIKFLNTSAIYRTKPLDYLRKKIEPFGYEIYEECAIVGERNWRFDGLVVDSKTKKSTGIAIEIEGLNGRHQRTAGFIEDMLKYNTAAFQGYKLLRFTGEQCITEQALITVLACIKPYVYGPVYLNALKENKDWSFSNEFRRENS